LAGLTEPETSAPAASELKTRHRQRTLWVASWILAGASVLSAALADRPWTSPYYFGKFLGNLLWPGIVIAVGALIQKRVRKRRLQPLFLWVALVLAVSAGFHLVIEMQTRGLMREAAKLVSLDDETGMSLLAYVDSVKAQMAAGSKIEPLGQAASRFGRAAPLAGVINRYALGMQRDFLEYLSAVADAHPDSALSHPTLLSKRRTASMIRGLEHLAVLSESCERRVLARTKQLRDTIETIDVPELTRIQVLAGLASGDSSSTVAVSGYFRNERAICRRTVAVLQFMQAKRGMFELTNGSWAFQRQQDADSFNALVGSFSGGGELDE
jgi:hypothetical protein